VGQPTFNPARTRLTRGLSEPGWVQPTFEKVEFFSTQPGSNPWWAGLAHGLNPILTSLPPSISSAPPKNLKIPKIPFDHLKKRTDITPPKILPDVDFRKSKYMTSGSQKSSPEVDFRKSKIITGSRLPEIKNHPRKSTSGSQKKLRKSTSVYKKNIFYFI